MLISLMRDHFNVKMFLPNFVHCEKASSLVILGFKILGFKASTSDSWLIKKICAEGDQLHGGLAKYVRVDTRFHFTT